MDLSERVKLLTAVSLGFGIGALLIGGAFFINAKRPKLDQKPTGEEVLATGKCAECHVNTTKAVVYQFEHSKHAKVGVTCYDCHKPQPGQESAEHNGFSKVVHVTAKNCASCHPEQYREYEESRHAGPSWGAVYGETGFSAAQLASAEKHHPGSVKRPPHPLTMLEGAAASKSGCEACHSVGRPNADGSFGQCTECHSRHEASVALAREPRTCGQCHMGPDHSQIEIYEESKHGVLFAAHRERLNLEAPPKTLTVKDMPVPVCATCHMSGLEGAGVTHNVSSRLSYWLYAPVSDKRPNADAQRANMQMICFNCHAPSRVLKVYEAADQVVEATNAKVKEAQVLYDKIKKRATEARRGGGTEGFSRELDFMMFDLWHYYGRTAKHGAFMGGPDFVQWHGNYEITKLLSRLHELDADVGAKP